MPLQAADVIETARSFIGTPWRHQGRMPGRGLDCIGLLVKVAHTLELESDDYLTYTRYADYQQFLELFRRYAIEVDRLKVQPGMAVIIPTSGTAHCGLIAGTPERLTLIHSTALRKRVVEERYSLVWRSRTTAAFAFRGVDY